MNDHVLVEIKEKLDTIADSQMKGLFASATNELNLHEKKITSNLQKIKNEIKPFNTPNRDQLVNCAIDLSGYVYENIDHPNPFFLQKLCEFLLLRKDLDGVINRIEQFLLDVRNKDVDANSVEFLTITLASAYAWKDKKYLPKAVSLLEHLNNPSLRVKDSLAKLYYSNSEFDKVLAIAASCDSMNSQLALWRAKTLFQLGRVNEAIDGLKGFEDDNDVAKFLNQIRIQQRKPIPTAPKSFKVFISYSSDDREYVNKLVPVLDEFGIHHFLDQKDINWGEHIADGIHKGLSNCDAIIVIVSPASLKSQWVPYEIGRAAGQNKKVLPLLTHPALDVPGYMRDLKYITSLDQARQYFERAAKTVPPSF